MAESEQQGAAPATAQAVAGRIFDDAVRHDLKPNGRCWVACDMNIAAALIAAYADARVAEATEKHVQRARIEIGRRVVAEAEVARLTAQRDALRASLSDTVDLVGVVGAERDRLLAALTDAAAMFRKRAMEQRLRNHLAGVDAYSAAAVIVETLRDDCAALAGPPPAATGGTA